MSTIASLLKKHVPALMIAAFFAHANTWLALTGHSLAGAGPYEVFTYPEDRLMPDLPPITQEWAVPAFNYFFFFIPSFLVAALACELWIWSMRLSVLIGPRLLRFLRTAYVVGVLIAGFLLLAFFWDDGPLYQRQPADRSVSWLVGLVPAMVLPFAWPLSLVTYPPIGALLLGLSSVIAAVTEMTNLLGAKQIAE
jgi:hypothetical protein